MAKTSKKEEYKVKGEKLLARVKELVKEGNIRTIVVKDQKKKVVAQIPLTFGFLGFMLAPFFSLITTGLALLADYTIEVERK